MEFTVSLGMPFSLEYTLESGQLFRWERSGEWWRGIVRGSVLKLKQEGEVLRCSTGNDLIDSTFVSSYFRLDDALDHILATLSKDETITRAVQKFYGLRLVSQDPWECLASFVLATNANIPRIKKMVGTLCANYGRPFEFEGATHAAFPSPGELAVASEADLLACGLGYRAPFLKQIATSVASGNLDFNRLGALGYHDSREFLVAELPGVGPKVADCVLLYSLGKDEAFPIDVWIARVLAKTYPRLLSPELRKKLSPRGKVKLSSSDYDKISAKVRAYFGGYAGYAQQYLYIAAREHAL